MESWDKGYEILDDANKKSEKFRKQVEEIMKSEKLSIQDYEKIKSLLEKESEIRNDALEKVEKIHREQTKNFEQEWSNS